jgi:hypothetical protein
VTGDRTRERAAMAARLARLLPRLNERDRRLALGAEAQSWGRGGIEEVHLITGASRSTISWGIRELTEEKTPPDTEVISATFT